jgi:hypothetical protein
MKQILFCAKMSIIFSGLAVAQTPQPTVHKKTSNAAKVAPTAGKTALSVKSTPAPPKMPPPQGALPRGETVEAAKPMATATAKPKSVVHSCYDHMLTLPASHGAFADGGRTFYIMTKARATNTTATQANRATLYSVNMDTFKAAPILRTNAPMYPAISILGQPAAGASVLAFQGNEDPLCGEGRATLANLSFTKASIHQTATRSQGRFAVFKSDQGSLFADVSSNNIIEVDMRYFQSRKVQIIPKGEKPLYFATATKRLVTTHRPKDAIVLKEYTQGNIKSAFAELALPVGARVIQQGALFASGELDTKANKIKIKELARWSGVGEDQEFSLVLPALFTVSDATMTIDFHNRLALVYGASEITRKRWSSALLYQYSEPEPVKIFDSPKDSFISQGWIDPTSTYVILEIKETSSMLSKTLRILNLKTNRISEVVL